MPIKIDHEQHRATLIKEGNAQLVRHTGRLMVFAAIEHSGDLESATQFYTVHAEEMLSGRVDRWAQGNGIVNLEEIRKDESLRTLDKDLKIARRFQAGVTIEQRTGKKVTKVDVFLPDLIAEERTHIQKIQHRLGKII